MPKTRAYQAPLSDPGAFPWVSADKRLSQLHANTPAGLIGLYAMLGAPSFKGDSWMDTNPNPYILSTVEC